MKILLVEDDKKIAATVKRGLDAEGFAVEVSLDGDDGLWKATEHYYDLVILDLMLPGLSGYQLCRTLRERGDWTPILVLTAKDGEFDETRALDTGADDYLTKPFAFAELAARVLALGRRSRPADPPVLRRAGLTLDPSRHEVFRDGRYVPLAKKEFAVLAELLRADGATVSAEQLLEKAWDEHVDPFTGAVRLTILKLRRKLGEPTLVETVTGFGYRIP